MAALSQLWGMRTPLDLVGTSIDAPRAQWNNRLGGTGAGADSFYEYLLKAYLLFGKSDHLPVASPLTFGLLHVSGGTHERLVQRLPSCPIFIPSPHVQLLKSLSSSLTITPSTSVRPLDTPFPISLSASAVFPTPCHPANPLSLLLPHPPHAYQAYFGGIMHGFVA